MSGKFQSILLGGLIAGLLASVFGLFQYNLQSRVLDSVACCAVPTVGALMATWHYTSTNGITIRGGEGAMIGLIACILGYVISIVISGLISLTGLIPGPFDVDAAVELATSSMRDAGNTEKEIETATGIIKEYFYLFIPIGVVVYAAMGSVVGAIGSNLFKHGAPDLE